MKKIVVSTLLAISVAVPVVASAQFSIPNPLKSDSGSSKASSGDLIGQQAALVKNYVAAQKAVLNANFLMADALGLKQAAEASKAQATALTEGATKDNLKDANKALSTTAKAVTEALKEGPKLDAAAKKRFSQGMDSLAAGILKYVVAAKNAKNMSSALSSASPMDLPKLQPAVEIVGSLPTSVKSAQEALSSAIAYSKDQGIPVPKNATKALADL